MRACLGVCICVCICARSCVCMSGTLTQVGLTRMKKCMLLCFLNCEICVHLAPTPQFQIQIVGPTLASRLYSDGTNYTNFYFTCRVTYVSVQTDDDGAKFDVALTFNGVPSIPVTTNSSALDVIFMSSQLKGNVGKLVNVN